MAATLGPSTFEGRSASRSVTAPGMARRESQPAYGTQAAGSRWPPIWATVRWQRRAGGGLILKVGFRLKYFHPNLRVQGETLDEDITESWQVRALFRPPPGLPLQAAWLCPAPLAPFVPFLRKAPALTVAQATPVLVTDPSTAGWG